MLASRMRVRLAALLLGLATIIAGEAVAVTVCHVGEWICLYYNCMINEEMGCWRHWPNHSLVLIFLHFRSLIL